MLQRPLGKENQGKKKVGCCPCDTAVCNHLSQRRFLIKRQRIYSSLACRASAVPLSCMLMEWNLLYAHRLLFLLSVNRTRNPWKRLSDGINSMHWYLFTLKKHSIWYLQSFWAIISNKNWIMYFFKRPRYIYISLWDYTKEAVGHEFGLSSKKLTNRNKNLSLEKVCSQQFTRPEEGFIFFRSHLIFSIKLL